VRHPQRQRSSPPSPNIETLRARQIRRACEQLFGRDFMIASQLKWLQSLGLPAVLPPPEEKQHVSSAVEAAVAKDNRRN
jgi:hypothetical protein